MIKQTIIDIVESLQKDSLDYELLKIKDEALRAIAIQDIKFQHHTTMAYVSYVNTFKKYRYNIIENYTPANDFNEVLEDGYIERAAYGYRLTKTGKKFYKNGGYRWENIINRFAVFTKYTIKSTRGLIAIFTLIVIVIGLILYWCGKIQLPILR